MNSSSRLIDLCLLSIPCKGRDTSDVGACYWGRCGVFNMLHKIFNIVELVVNKDGVLHLL